MLTRKLLIPAFICLLSSSSLSAGMVISSLGNTSPAFADGSTPDIFQLTAAQSGQPAPFNAPIGHELIGPNFDASWSHTYGAIADPITSVSITIGIADHDSMASGSQVALFQIDGFSFTAALDSLFESSGGADNMYNEYTLNLSLSPALTTALADGNANVRLALAGPGLQTSILPGHEGEVSETPFNSANLIFSTLTIQTRDTTPTPTVPEPTSLALFAFGTLGFGMVVRRRRRNRLDA